MAFLMESDENKQMEPVLGIKQPCLHLLHLWIRGWLAGGNDLSSYGNFMKRKFKDFHCFGGWLTIKWRPKLLVWWSKDATPPSNSNPGIWLIGSYTKWALCDDN